MTRETKIGLLVGLAFIIIVGILLSEPLNHAGDAQPAPLPFAGANVRTGVTSPGAQSTPPPISLQTNASDAKERVPTHEEVAKPHTGISVVVVGGGPSNPIAANPQVSTPLSNTGENEVQPPVTHPPAPRGNEVANGGRRVSTPPPSNGGGDPIFTAGHEGGEEIVPLGTRPETKVVNTSKPKAARQYEAVAGDSLSKIAQKFYGSSAKNFRDAIVAANPSMKGDPNKIIIGQAYAIPAVENAAVNTPAPTPTPTPVVVGVAPPQKAKPAGNENWYTVKPGDNLWAIARDQCGDAGAVPAIKELNKDFLKGADVVKVGMKLRLPNKPLASAN